MSEFTSDEIEGIVKAMSTTIPAEKQKIPLKPLFKVEFSSLEEETKGEKGSFEHLHVDIEILFGKTVIPLKKLLSLSEGSVLDFDEEENQKLEIRANGKKVGYGEVVSCEGKFGVKIVQLSK